MKTIGAEARAFAAGCLILLLVSLAPIVAEGLEPGARAAERPSAVLAFAVLGSASLFYGLYQLRRRE